MYRHSIPTLSLWRKAQHLATLPFILFLALVEQSSPCQGQTDSDRGYQERACGFDLNHDGEVGGAGDCDLCNGRDDESDPDVDEIYVSCAQGRSLPGQDDEFCGAPESPCATLTHALNIADGPNVGHPDVICFRNTCAEESLSFKPFHGGREEVVRVLPVDRDGQAWLVPYRPAMIVGWDQNQNGVYPPADFEDEAVLIPPSTCPGMSNQACDDGSEFAQIQNPDASDQRFYQKPLERAFYIQEQVSHIELAHFSVRDYGRYTLTNNSGLLDFAADSASANNHFVYMHDLEVDSLNRDSNFTSNTSAINMFKWFQSYVYFENMLFDHNGHWFARGGDNAGPDRGPVRWKNISVNLDTCRPPVESGCDPATDPSCSQGYICTDSEHCEPAPGDACVTRAATAIKIWGYYSNFEILDSVFDTGLLGQESLELSGMARGIDVAQCLQGWTIRNNELIDFNSPIEVTPVSNFCGATARPVDNLMIDGNLIRHPAPVGAFDQGILLEPGGSRYAGQHIENVTLVNNMISSVDGLESCIILDPGFDYLGSGLSDVPGTVHVLNNTCYGPITQGAGIVIGSTSARSADDNSLVLQHDIVVRNNIVSGLDDSHPNIATTYLPANLEVDHNVWDPSAGFRWADVGREQIDYSEWSQQTGDRDASLCAPTMMHVDGSLRTGDPAPVEGDLHLSPEDSCAQDRGTALTSWSAIRDADGDRRPDSSRWDVGADEIAVRPLSQPPLRYSGSPTGSLSFGMTEIVLSLSTDQEATCDYLESELGSAPPTPYGHPNRKSFGESSTDHEVILWDLVPDRDYVIEVRCSNLQGVVNEEDYLITFKIAGPLTDLVAHWSFDSLDGCQAKDASGNGLHAWIGGSCDSQYEPAPTAQGALGSALEFDGVDDYLEVADDDRLNITSSLTISAWVRLESFGDNEYGRILAKQRYIGGFGPGYSFYVGDRPDGVPAARRALCANIDRRDSGCGDPESLSGFLTTEDWQHVAMVFDDDLDQVRFLVNGFPAGGFSVTGRPGSSSVPLRIGDRDDLARSFEGGLDDIRLWNRALTDSEIRSLAVAERPPARMIEDTVDGSLGLFPSGTPEVQIALLTNSAAACRMAELPGVAYDHMIEDLVGSPSGTHHQALIPTADGVFYRRYIRCRDDRGHTNEDDFMVSFYAGFHPSELPGVEFFIESRAGRSDMTLATASTADRLRDVENYCDTTLFPEGCVRRWKDLSGTVSARIEEVPSGRDFGQDDKEKPAFIRDCIQGLPCARTVDLSGVGHLPQEMSFEVELVDSLEPITGPFSLYLLVRPQDKGTDFGYLGFNGSSLRHRAEDDSLELRIGGSEIVSLPGAVPLGMWHLIEIHRHDDMAVEIVVDGADVTTSSSTVGGDFLFRFLLSDVRVDAMFGDLAATLIVDGSLDVGTRDAVSDYFTAVYGARE